MVGEAEGDDFKYVLTFDGDSARLERVGQTSASELKVIPLGGKLYHLTGGDESEPMRGYFRMRTDDEALLFFSGRDRLFLAFKTTDRKLDEIQGEWKGLAGSKEIDVLVEGNHLTFGSDETIRATLMPLEPQHGDLRAVSFPEQRDSYLLYFTPLQKDLWLVRNHEEDDFLIMYRGQSPGWVKAELELRKAGSDKASTEAVEVRK